MNPFVKYLMGFPEHKHCERSEKWGWLSRPKSYTQLEGHKWCCWRKKVPASERKSHSSSPTHESRNYVLTNNPKRLCFLLVFFVPVLSCLFGDKSLCLCENLNPHCRFHSTAQMAPQFIHVTDGIHIYTIEMALRIILLFGSQAKYSGWHSHRQIDGVYSSVIDGAQTF